LDRRIPTKRLNLVAVVTLAALVTLVARLWSLQVVEAPSLSQRAAGGRVRVVQTESPRGRILDASGTVVVDRRESLVVTVDRTVAAELPAAELERSLTELAVELTRWGFKTKEADLRRELDHPTHDPLAPAPVAEDVDPGLWAVLAERDLPAVSVERRWVRSYPYGEVGAQVLGYVGTANRDQLDRAARDGGPKPYRPGDEIGKAGIEAQWEHVLRGVPEVRRVEVDARGNVVRTIEVVQPGRPGDDVVLTLDLDAQARAEQIVSQQLEAARQRLPRRDNVANPAPAGSLVVVDPTTGGIVVAASVPGFDPGELVFGLSQDQADHLFRSDSRPFLNRALSGEYPAASTFKPFVALAALRAGLTDEREVVVDNGRYTIAGCHTTATAGCVFRNAGDNAYGPVDLRDSLVVSSDVYYYRLGDLFWSDRRRVGPTAIQDLAASFGFGQALGTDLPQQSAGYLPTPEAKAARSLADPVAFPEGAWRTGDNLNLAIGQGDLLVTPLQLANAYATLANGGTVHAPRLVSEIRDGTTGAVVQSFGPVVVRQLDLDPGSLDAVRNALLDVPVDGTDGRGTAATAFQGFPLDRFPVAGKTGTAQVTGRADNSMFAAFGPWPEPRYAAVALLEQAGFGGEAAAPAVRELLEGLAGIVPLPAAVPSERTGGVR
jgi:penicillin-binding protein 2